MKQEKLWKLALETVTGKLPGDITQEKQTGYSSLAVSVANKKSQALPFLVTWL